MAEEALGRTAGIRLTGPDTKVLSVRNGDPVLTLHPFGKGKAVYFGGFSYSPDAARMLLELLAHLTGADGTEAGWTDRPEVECAWFPKSRTLVSMNSADQAVQTEINGPFGRVSLCLGPHQTLFKEIETN